VFFSKVWAECRDILTLDEFAALKGSIAPANDRNPQKPSLKVSSIADIAALSRSAPPVAPVATQPSVTQQAVHVRLNSEAAGRDEGVFPLRDYILGNPGPCPVFIHISSNGEKVIRAAAGISPEAELKNCAGVVETWKELCV